MRWLPIVPLGVFAACRAPYFMASPEEVAPGDLTLPGGKYVVELPAGWLRERSPDDEVVVVRDHPYLTQLIVSAGPRDDAFFQTKRGSSEEMTPAVLAERALEETRSILLGRGGGPIVVLENRAIEAGGRPAFFLHMRIESPGGLPYEHLQAGFVRDDTWYWIWFRSPSIHYFERDRWAFDRAVATIRPKESARNEASN